MWCAHCQTEVAAEVASDNRRIHCASCGQDIASTQERRPLSTTQEARELLERWSNERIVDPYGPLRQSPRIAVGTSGTESQERSEDSEKAANSDRPAVVKTKKPTRTRRLRIDGAQKTPLSPSKRPVKTATPVVQQAEQQAEAPPEPVVNAPTLNRESTGRIVRVHQAHAAPAPHLDLANQTATSMAPTINWMAVAGQWLAYLGILALTAGTGLVLLGHFRGPVSYVPTGWLVTMAGQMLLFLGVMTTFSTGMEKSTDTVSRKIDDLSERIIRMEEAGREVRRPTTPPAETHEPHSKAESA